MLIFVILSFCIQSRARFVSEAASVTTTAVQNNWDRLESSLNAKIATMPATTSTDTNSKGRCKALAQMRIMMTWVINAVRESINTRMKMGTITNGMI